MGAVPNTTISTCRCPHCGEVATTTIKRGEAVDGQAARRRIAVRCPYGCSLTQAELAAIAQSLT
jgi:hypothetical protein